MPAAQPERAVGSAELGFDAGADTTKKQEPGKIMGKEMAQTPAPSSAVQERIEALGLQL